MSIVQTAGGGVPVAAGVETKRPAAGRKGARKRGARRALVALAFVGPYVLLLLFVGIGPAVYGAVVSVEHFVGGSSTGFAGLANWLAVWHDQQLGAATRNVGLFLAYWLPSLVVIVVMLSLLLHARAGRFSTTMRLAFYIPGAITGSAAALLWIFMLSPQTSPAKWVLHLVGIHSVTDVVSGSHLAIVLAVIGVAVSAGGWIVIMYGALVALPGEILDAARIGGASAWRLAWSIKLPMVRPYVVLMLITTFAQGTQVFAEPVVLSTGAPGQISPTWSLNQLAYYYATQLGDFGRAAALSLGLLAVGLVVAMFVILRTRLYSTDGG